MRITVTARGECLLTLPHRIATHHADRFVQEHASWIHQQIERLRSAALPFPASSRTAYVMHRELARSRIEDAVRRLNGPYGFHVGMIRIKDLASRWGSCSSRGNLNFTYRLIFLPQDLFDYVIVHEICHLGELNHSSRFWNLVAQTVPDHKERRKALACYPL
jgi:predicted metal-dependent hydrolase